MSKLRYKDIQAMHEVRMWITEVLFPVGITLMAVEYKNPGFVKNCKDKIKAKFNKNKN